MNCKLHGISDKQETIDSLFLVVNNTSYHKTVPVLIGTNILSPLLSRTRDTYGVRYLQRAQLCTPWYLALRCLTLREKELDQRSHILTLVKSAEAGLITIAPNSNVTIHGYLYNEVPNHTVCALLQPTKYSYIPTDHDIEPSLITYDLDQISTVPVNISNITTRTVTVYPRDTLCEIQPVTIQDFHISSASATHTNILDDVRISKEELTLEQLQQHGFLASQVPRHLLHMRYRHRI